MINADLKKLAELKAPERTFLSIYLSGPHALPALEKKLGKLRSMLKSCGDRDERAYFDENAKTVLEYLKKNPFTSGALCIFACREIGFFEAVSLPSLEGDIVRVDATPYIRPLAEYYDEYETVAVVVADNAKVRIFLVSSSAEGSEETFKGNIKNHVRVGGWSQQRYERRRDKQLLHYAREITDALMRLKQEEKFGHVLLVGGREILDIVYQNMPKELKDKIIEKNLDLSRGESHVNHDILLLLEDEEHRAEQDYWERIRSEYLRGGLAVLGLQGVLAAAKQARVNKALIDHALHSLVKRCQSGETPKEDETATCTVCGSEMVFNVSQVNELLEALIRSGSEFHFADSIPELGEAGGVAALLRY